MKKYKVVKNFTAEEAGGGSYVCRLHGGRISFTEDERGRYHVAVDYDAWPGYSLHAGPFDSLDGAGYYIAHTRVSPRLVGFLADNGILEEVR